MKYLRRNVKGLAVLEAAVTLPIVCWLIFFIFESIIISKVRASLDAIAMECSFDFMTSKNQKNFDAIISKHLESALIKNIGWYFIIYEDLSTMCTDTFGEDVILPGCKIRVQLGSQAVTHKKGTRVEKNGSLTVAGGNAFVLTFTYEYKFTSAFVQQLFGGGYNTSDGKKCILWSRGVGVCN